ncbi:MAG: MASE1 domain-containing protein [Gallionella sp.]|nr:MASE1 domain-containing protein [Gallionella sp.]
MPTYKFTLQSTSLKQFGIAALYALLFYLGDLFFESDAIVGHFEPACGLALAALLIGGKRYACGVFLGAVLIHIISGESLWQAITIASSDALEALCGAWLLMRSDKFDSRLPSLHDYLRLTVLGGAISIAISALAANLVLLVLGLLTVGDYFHSLLKWWMSDTLGVILVTPLILVWRRSKYNWHEARQMIEAVLLLGLTIFVGQVVFLDWLHDIVGEAPQNYWMFLLITWVAMVLGTRGTTLALLVVAIQALSGAMRGIGYFADDIAASHLMNFWFYMLILSMVGMSLATYFHEIKQANFAISYRDALIREIHHRIKNNLQGITGLLRQLANSHPETTESINQTIGQVQSIAAIHGLQERETTSNMRLHELAEAVAAGVGSLWQKPIAVEIPTGWPPYTIDEAEAVPLALILNELLSNAIKHGGGGSLQVKIMLKHGQRPDSIQLIIHNPGQLPPGFDFERNTGTGLQLVQSLMPRAGARLTWKYQNNMVITLLELEPPVITLKPEP